MSAVAKRAKAANLDAIHDTVHEMARDEARHGKAFEGLLRDTLANPIRRKIRLFKRNGWRNTHSSFLVVYTFFTPLIWHDCGMENSI